VAHNIIAVDLVGEWGALKSLLDGMEMDERYSESFCNVGLVNRCVTVCLGGGVSSGTSWVRLTLLFLRILSSTSSTSSTVCRITVHPGGKAEWCRSRLLDLKVKPPKMGETVSSCPLGRRTCCTTMPRALTAAFLGAIVQGGRPNGVFGAIEGK